MNGDDYFKCVLVLYRCTRFISDKFSVSFVPLTVSDGFEIFDSAVIAVWVAPVVLDACNFLTLPFKGNLPG